jgi:copper transport protein
MRWLLLAFALGIATAFAPDGGGLEAHALLIRADPPENAQLREPPSQIALYFSEPLERQYSRVSVINQDGERVDERFEFLEEDDAAMRVVLLPLEPGYLSVQWETVSTVDGHRITGSFPLTLLKPDGSLPAGQAPDATSTIAGDDPEPLRVIDKWVLLVAGSILAGALAFLGYVTPVRSEDTGDSQPGFQRLVLRVAMGALAVMAVAGIAELVLQAIDIDTSVSSVLGTRWGERWLYRNLLLIPLALLLAGLANGLANGRLLATAALVLAAAYMLLTSSVSHAGAGGGSFWAIASDFVHLSASSVWIGMVFLLALLFWWTRKHMQAGRRYATLAGALRRFSVVAVLSVALLLFTGTVNAVIEVGRFADLLETDYGLALTLKLLLLLPLLAIAAYNAYLLRPDFAEAADPGTSVRDRQGILQELESQLNRRVRWEFAVAVAVLAVVAVLVQLTPSRGRVAPPSQAEGKYVETVEVEDLSATLVITPNQPGFNTFEVYLAGRVTLPDGNPAIEGLRLEFTDPGGFASESRLILDPSNPPTFYLGQGPYLTDPGTWNIVLNIRRSEGTDLRPTFTVDVEDTGPVAASAGRTGGSFDSPIDFSTGSIVLLVVSGVVCAGIVAGSVRRPGLPEGYLGWLAAEVAYRVGPVHLRPVWALGGLVVIGIALGLVLGDHLHPVLSREEASSENPVPATQESIARGAMLFSQNCTVCHGETGRGDGPLASTLPIQPVNFYDHVPVHPDEFFFGVISRGLGSAMPAFEDQISEEDRWNILNYLRATFTKQPADK